MWQVETRKFRCDNPGCSQGIFTERLPGVAAHARRTDRLGETLLALALALGGEAGSRVAGRIGIPTSPDTLLRLLWAQGDTPIPTPRILGVDDWAIRRREVYGTLLYDLETHEPVDLIPGRSAKALETWLKEHPGVEVISRDRGGPYAEGASLGAPKAVQVADRFHLLMNLAAAVERYCARHPQESAQEEAPAAESPQGVQRTSRQEAESRSRRDRRKARFDAVWEGHRNGLSQTEIARRTGLTRTTVRKYLQTEGAFPEIASRGPRKSALDPYKPYLLKRWNEGCHSARRLFEEIRAQGYAGGMTILKQWTHRLRGPAPPRVRRRSPRSTAWILLGAPEDLSPKDRYTLDDLLAKDDRLARLHVLVHDFIRMARDRDGARLSQWITDAEASSIPELKAFVVGIFRDLEAVRAGLTLPWSQGPVEGCIHKLKLIKRQTYGRASLAHLRARLLKSA